MVFLITNCTSVYEAENLTAPREQEAAHTAVPVLRALHCSAWGF